MPWRQARPEFKTASQSGRHGQTASGPYTVAVARTNRPILVLGAGINGAAIARELVLNRVPVVVVDTADIAFGTTAYASRLIHGGLRYLEYGELDLVRESLAERTRLLRLAPQFVRPLQLFIPVENRWRGWLSAAAKFFQLPWRLSATAPPRGAWLVRTGLRLYDAYARDPVLPRHETHRVGSPGTPPVDPRRFVAVCSYFDAQIPYPERFTLALLEDARRMAEEEGVEFRVLTYHQAELQGSTVEVTPLLRTSGGTATWRFEPAAIVNATGAWVDMTLKKLHVESPLLIGGTKGSHFLTSQSRLRGLLGDHGIYAEAADGRPVFILPLGQNVLVGTTDLPFAGDPAAAVASGEELEYLLATVNHIFPQARLTADDIDWHYCGIRPLPHVGEQAPAAITRRHWMQEQPGAAVPTYSIIGGKLTTCRSLAEESVAKLLGRLGLPRIGDSRDRLLPGAEAFPREASARLAEWDRLANRFGVPRESIERITGLVGTRAVPILSSLPDTAADEQRPVELLTGTFLPRSFVAWVIRSEWVETLDDLVERRLMLLFDPDLGESCLREMAEMLVTAEKLDASQIGNAVKGTITRLSDHFGKRVQVLERT